MDLKYRRIYALTIMILFMVIAPLLIFYTAGYRYNFKKRMVIRTGVLNVDSKPDKAIISLNGKIKKVKTTAIIKNLLPQEYNIELKKTDFYSWQKKLTVYPGRVTFTDKINLLRKSSPSLFSQDKITYLTVSPAQSFLAYLAESDQNTNLLRVFNLNEAKEITKIPINVKINLPLNFSPTEDYLYLSQEKDNKNNFLIIYLKEKKEPLSLMEVSPLNFTVIKDSSLTKGIIYGLSEGKLFKIDLNKKSIELILDDFIQDFTITGNNLNYLSRRDENYILKRIDLNNISSSQELLDLSMANFKLEKNDRGNLTLFDPEENRLALIESQAEFSFTFKQLNPLVLGYRWSLDQKKLLFYNEFEIWILDLENNKQELLLRSSETIKAAEWLPNQSWILFKQINTIKAIETDGRDKRNIIDLTECLSNYFSFSSLTGRIYFIGLKDHPDWLYQLDID